MDSPGVTERLLRRDWMVLMVLIGFLFGLAGFYTVSGVGMHMSALEMTAMRGMRDMSGAGTPGQWTTAYAALVFLMWWVMMIAMMLPSVAPTILLYSALLRRASQPIRVPLLASMFLAGYLTVWAAFSAIAMGAQWELEAIGYVSATMMTLLHTAPGAVVLIVAGLFQFTLLKGACLRHCRSPAEFITQRKRSGATGALLMGLEHGVYCLGCCWFLMALLFVGGVMNLYWIVALAAFLAIEKLASFGEKLAKVGGALLFAWGVYALIGAI
jgi:predicted metal-binding membrane protein